MASNITTMNYKEMAKAIRSERRAIWEALGKPEVLAWRYKLRQMGATSYTAERLLRQSLGIEHVPWRDLFREDESLRLLAEFRKHYPLRPNDCFIAP
jgi:predicted nucleic acid-binding protein